MKDIFYEESAVVQNKKTESVKYNTMNVLSIVFFILSLIWLVFALTLYPLSGKVLLDILGMVIPELIFLSSAFLFFFFKYKFCIDYDYSFISGTIKVSKIINNLNRRFMFKFEAKSIIKLGKYGSQTYNKLQALPDVEKVVLTSNKLPADGKSFYYLIATINSERKLLVFECTEVFMVNVLKFSNKNIVEEDFE